MLTRVINNMVFILLDSFVLLRLNLYISTISSVYNPDQHLSLSYQTICDHMFSDPKLDHTLHVFWLHTWIIYISSLMWQLSA